MTSDTTLPPATRAPALVLMTLLTPLLLGFMAKAARGPMFANLGEIAAIVAGLVLLAVVFVVGELWHAICGRSSAGRGRAIAISRGADKAALARELGAHEYIDTAVTSAAEGLQKLGGADLVLATA